MKKSVKFLLPMLAVALLLGLSSVSCASNVKGKTFKEEGKDVTVKFTTKSDCVFTVEGKEYKGTYKKPSKKQIVCVALGAPNGYDVFSFDIINAKTLKDKLGGTTWKKI